MYENYADNSRIHPPLQYVKIGSNARFTCDALSPLRWSFNKGSLPTNAASKKSSLYITNVKTKNEGNYECRGRTRNGSFFGAIGKLVLQSKSYYQ